MSKTDTVQVALKGTGIRPHLCQYHQAKNIYVCQIATSHIPKEGNGHIIGWSSTCLIEITYLHTLDQGMQQCNNVEQSINIDLTERVG